MTKLLDRWDHHARLLPFLLAGKTKAIQQLQSQENIYHLFLFLGFTDSAVSIQKLTLNTIRLLGLEYMEENKTEMLEKLQYNVDGRANYVDYNASYPEPWKERPNGVFY